MSQTIHAEPSLDDGVHFVPGASYRWLGILGALVFGGPLAVALVTVGPAVGPVAGLALAAAVALAYWTAAERAWVGPEGVWIKSLPGLRERFVPWQTVDELALPVGALRSPWMWLSSRERVRLPMFVDSERFCDAVGVYAPDVVARTSDVILHTESPRGRWIEGVWICDAHRRKWCKACNAEATLISLPGTAGDDDLHLP